VAAEAKTKGSVAAAMADMRIVEAENELRVKRANLAAEANRNEAISVLATDIARVEEQQKLERLRLEMNKSKYEADIVIPARAERSKRAEGYR